jgi:hypothetical protein
MVKRRTGRSIFTPEVRERLAKRDKLMREIDRSAAEARDVVVFEPPKVEGRDVMASLANSTHCGKQLAARVWALGLVGSGSAADRRIGQPRCLQLRADQLSDTQPLSLH